ncbi:hypothetical protein NOGI109294_15350 [Nocardiopsis gilva]|uniref:hypothetical protein n=1 Tax=Nocardiopsis gilva TaxID=280236 RepID=UPI00034DDADB|nr:hypothetical protein [Nocardiopsis gilva]
MSRAGVLMLVGAAIVVGGFVLGLVPTSCGAAFDSSGCPAAADGAPLAVALLAVGGVLLAGGFWASAKPPHERRDQ